MRVLITGAGGFIGSHLVEQQLRLGRQVTALDLHVESLENLAAHPQLTILEGDFADAALTEQYLKDLDICFHLASAHLETDVDEQYFFKVNVQEARDFVQRCCEAGVGRFVHCSSVGVYGDIENPPADEGSECNPDVAYERSKLAGEQAVMEFAREANYPVVVVRPAWVYGPRCPRTVRLFRTIKKGRFFFVGDGKTLRHPIHIDDMTAGFELAATHPNAPGEVFIMAGPRAVTLVELADEIAAVIGVKKPSLKLPKAPVWLGCILLEAGAKVFKYKPPFTRRSLKFYTGNTAFSIQKVKDMLGFDPEIDLKEGLQQTCDWMYSSGKI
jgi:nucleoside-diphosphate-sugar epimerase